MTARPGDAAAVRGGWRLLRTGVLGGASILLAVGAHLLGGGGVPNAAVVVLAGALAGIIAGSVTARRCRLPLLVGVLAVEQLGLHLLFSAAAGETACGAVSAVWTHGAHGQTLCGPTQVHPAMAGGPGWLMTATHLAAVLLTAWLLARGEQWVWNLVAVAAACLAVRPTRRRSRPSRQVSTRGIGQFGCSLLTVAPTRGPPRA